jgi:hypothetical protein
MLTNQRRNGRYAVIFHAIKNKIKCVFDSFGNLEDISKKY